MSLLRRHRGLLLILLLSALFRGMLIDQPFHRNGEGMGSFYGILGRNYIEHGLKASALVPILGVGTSPVAADGLKLYPNHPPLVPLLVAGSYAALGDGNWQTRLPSVLFTLGCIALLYGLLHQRRGVRCALIAAALFASAPIVLRFGGQPDVINAQLAFFILLATGAYLRLHDHPTPGRLLALMACLLLAVLTDWPGFYVVPIFCAHWAITRRWRQWGWIIAFGAFSIICFAALYVHVSVVTGNWSLIADQVLRRSADSQTDVGRSFDWAWWWQRAVLGHNVINHTWPILMLAVGWIALRPFRYRQQDRAAGLAGLLLAIGLLHVAVGRQGVLVHDWWWWPITPGLSMAAALLLDDAIEWLGQRMPRWKAPITVLTTVAILLLAGRNTVALWRWFHDPFTVFGGQSAYSVVELGQAISAAAPPNHAVAVVDRDDEPSVWYYGWRPVVMDIWSMDDLRIAGQQPYVDLVFGYRQTWSEEPAGLVFPMVFAERFADFRSELRATYRQIDVPIGLAGKFELYDLRNKNRPDQLDDPGDPH